MLTLGLDLEMELTLELDLEMELTLELDMDRELLIGASVNPGGRGCVWKH